jgi:hypothetical protein
MTVAHDDHDNIKIEMNSAMKRQQYAWTQCIDYMQICAEKVSAPMIIVKVKVKKKKLKLSP